MPDIGTDQQTDWSTALTGSVRLTSRALHELYIKDADSPDNTQSADSSDE
jgi:hypothetical protein